MKLILLSLIIVSMASVSVNAQEITAVTYEWPPYNYTKNGEVIGMATEIVKAALDRAQLKATFLAYPWARAYKMASEEENTLIYTMGRIPDREGLFKWVAQIIPPVNQHLFKLKRRTDIVINSLEDAKKYHIGVMRDDSGQQILLNAGFKENKNLFVVANDDANIQNLFRERVDLIPGFAFPFKYQIKKLGYDPQEVEQTILILEGGKGYMAFSPQTSDDIVKRVQSAFEELDANGTVAAIVEKYTKMDQ